MFIAANCDEGECRRIFSGLSRHENSLNAIYQSNFTEESDLTGEIMGESPDPATNA